MVGGYPKTSNQDQEAGQYIMSHSTRSGVQSPISGIQVSQTAESTKKNAGHYGANLPKNH
jgi:hypothetical protein